MAPPRSGSNSLHSQTKAACATASKKKGNKTEITQTLFSLLHSRNLTAFQKKKKEKKKDKSFLKPCFNSGEIQEHADTYTSSSICLHATTSSQFPSSHPRTEGTYAPRSLLQSPLPLQALSIPPTWGLLFLAQQQVEDSHP